MSHFAERGRGAGLSVHLLRAARRLPRVAQSLRESSQMNLNHTKIFRKIEESPLLFQLNKGHCLFTEEVQYIL